MAFKALTTSLVSNAFTIVGDLAERATYLRVSSPEYDVDIGQVVESLNTIAVRAVRTKFRADERDDQVSVLTDAKALIPAADLGEIIPETSDEIRFPDGSRWDVRRSLSVPGESLYILHIRRR